MKLKYALVVTYFLVVFSLQAQAANTVNDTVYRYVDTMPEPAYNISRYLNDHLVYPDSAHNNNVQGRVVVQFTVSEGGKIADCIIAKSVSSDCDSEALKVIRKMPMWKPGIKNGHPVKTYATLPVTFKLVEDTGQLVLYYVDKPANPDYDFYGYKKQHLSYPESALKEDVGGSVLVKFIVNENGSISDCKVMSGIGGGCDEEAVRFIKNMPWWQPATVNNKPVKSYFTEELYFGCPPGKYKPVPPSGIYNHVEKDARPGYDVTEYLKKHLTYPDSAKNYGVDGMVVIKFVVDEKGHISNCEVLRSLGTFYDREALRVISTMPAWIPGMQNGKKVKAYYGQAVPFKLAGIKKRR